ncbi:MAG TPA: lipopolysaccharide transport periplasmic protein LptA [Allosphingosinicella sp.]|nr:lipopolysaccharide transport periplasmic protein LptA [Allosphingosinicella sp.]
MKGVTRFRILALLPLLAVAPAAGQQSGSGFNSNAPVDIDADRIEVQDRADRAIFSGNVVARQGNMTMNAARVTVAYTNSDGVQVERIEASGGVTLRTPSETARGNFAIYDVDRRIVTMIGGVHLTQGANRVQGGRLVLDLNSHRAVMDGGGTGGRVSGRFTVPQRSGGN